MRCDDGEKARLTALVDGGEMAVIGSWADLDADATRVEALDAGEN